MILKHCQDLYIHLNDDIEPFDLYTELLILRNVIKTKSSPLETLNFIKTNNLTDNFPNVSVSLRILLTMPVPVASGERSFFKLKLIKHLLRLTMTQERLSDLAILSIEYNIVQKLSFDDVIDDFSKQKARKVTI